MIKVQTCGNRTDQFEIRGPMGGSSTALDRNLVVSLGTAMLGTDHPAWKIKALDRAFPLR
jgi:hypothetical protein